MNIHGIIEREWDDLRSALAPYIAELGAVAFVAAGFFAVTVAVIEFLQPGFAVNFVSPRTVLAVVVLSAGLSLARKYPASERSRRQKTAYSIVGLLAAVLSFWAAWYYFQSVPEMRSALSWASALTVGFLFWASACRSDTDEV
jgi:FtsH-binding integral membrane protein